MLSFDVIASILLFTAFSIEFILILLHKPEADLKKDIAANFSLGICIIIVGIFEKGLAYSVFSIAYQFAIFQPELSWQLWVAAILCCDFVHYAYHWLGHRTRLFWAAHSTHHSSEHFNLSTGLRTNFIHLFYRFLFWSPLCLLGIPPQMILMIESVTASQNFIVHTEKIKKLGVLDWIFNTPSNHRVHHGCNPEYIDKNLGGIFMIFDHLFGTYAKETVKPVYGITHNIHTHNPMKILLHDFFLLRKGLQKIKGWRAKLLFLFSSPQ